MSWPLTPVLAVCWSRQDALEEARRQVRSHEDTIAAMESQREELLDYVQHQSEEVGVYKAQCHRRWLECASSLPPFSFVTLAQLSSALHRASVAESEVSNARALGEAEATKLQTTLQEAQADRAVRQDCTRSHRVQDSPRWWLCRLVWF